MEIGDNHINFLDVKLINKKTQNFRLVVNLPFLKDTSITYLENILLNFYSQHSVAQKRGPIILGLVD